MKQIFTLTLMAILCLIQNESKAQVTQNFDGTFPSSANGWTLTNFIASKPNEGNNGYGASTRGALTATLATPYIDIPANGTVQFDYVSNYNPGYSITFTLLDKNGNIAATYPVANDLAMSGYSHYTSPALAGGTYEVAINFANSLAQPNPGQKYVVVDNISVSGTYHYAAANNYINQAPVAGNDSYASSTLTGTITGNLLTNDSDPNGESLSITSNSGSTQGSLTVNSDGSFSFTPNSSFTGGPVTFTYTVTDNGYSPLSGTATVTLNYPSSFAILPVKLESFQAVAVKSDAVLNWTVALNEQGSYFEVQRSLTGSDFSTSGLVFEQETSGTASYNFTEALPQSSRVFYRLKMVGKDQSVSYSQVIEIDTRVMTTSNLAILGNPVRTDLSLQYTSGGSYQGVVTIYTMTGAIVHQQSVAVQAGQNLYHINLKPSLGAGFYLVEVAGNGQRTTTKMIKQ